MATSLALLLALSPIPKDAEQPVDELAGWYFNLDPETGETVGMVSVTTAGRGYFITWAYTPEFDPDQGTIKQRAAHGQGKRRANVLAVLWGKGELSTYEIHAGKNGVMITGDGELWLPAKVPNLTSIP